MQIFRTVAEVRSWRSALPPHLATVGFVPTMGYLHEGHLTLCRTARSRCDQVIVSIFVNPLQFGPGEDLGRYPKDEAGDIDRLTGAGVEALFLPSPAEMYPSGFATEVSVSSLTGPLCGISRPGHFKGVTTVVARLFHLVDPTHAYFGLKDYQQFLVIRKMVADLGMPIEVLGVPTVREPDGLAMSSRNAYLTPEGRRAARVLSLALAAVREAYRVGQQHPGTLERLLQEVLDKEPLAEVDYACVLDAETLSEGAADRPLVAALAVRIQGTRLIDNCVLTP